MQRNGWRLVGHDITVLGGGSPAILDWQNTEYIIEDDTWGKAFGAIPDVRVIQWVT